MEVTDDAIEVIDYNSDPETEQIPPHYDSGTNVVALQQPHSSNGKFILSGLR